MTKRLLHRVRSAVMLLMLSMISNMAIAQISVQIGSGSGTSSYFPIYSCYVYNYSQQIYLASELSTGGASGASFINKIRFQPSGTIQPSATWNSWTIYLGNTTQGGFANTASWVPTTNMTQVFTGLIPGTLVANQWMELTLTTPFLWDGSSNLVVGIYENVPNYYCTQNWAGYNATPPSTGTRGILFYSDPTNPNPASPPSANYTSNTIAQIQFDVTPSAACSGTPNAGSATVTNANPCSGQPISLGLTGNTAASGLTYQWYSSTSATGPWTAIDTAKASPFQNILSSTTNYYQALVRCGTDSAWSAPVLVTVPAQFPGGTYTIDPSQPASSTNFTNFASAVSAISCGISGSVIFNVAPNTTFNEQVTLPSTIGTNATRTVTFNGNNDTLWFNGTAAAPWTVGLNGADHITFNDFVIMGTNASSALVVHLWNQADTNTFNNCWMICNNNTTGSITIPFSLSGSANSGTTTGLAGNGNTVNGCKLISGYYGAMFYGNSGGANTGNKIINSVVRDFYLYGIYSYYQTGFQAVSDTMERPNRTTISTYYGIYLTTGSTGALLERNLIRNPAGAVPTNSVTAYGIYSLSAGTAANPNSIINNVIGQMNNRSSTYGLYMSGNYHRAFHNTVAITDTNASTGGTMYGLYASGTIGMAIRNNNVSITKSGTATKYAVYYSGAGKNSNNNNFFINSNGGTNYLGYYSTGAVNATSMAQWKATGVDTNSVSGDPLFVSPATSDFAASSAFIDNIGDPNVGVANDFLGTPRSTTTPDVGAYEFSAPACSGTPTAGTATGPVSACASAPITLTLTGMSNASNISIQWQSSPSGAGFFTDITGATNATYTDPGITSSMDYQAVVTCGNGGGFDVSNTVTVTTSPFYLCYCSPTNTNTTLHSFGYNYITNVAITGTTLNYTSPQSIGTTIPGGYNQLWPFTSTNSNTANLVQGVQYTLNATAAYTNYPISAWMDYDGSGTFDTSEFIPMTATASGTLYTGTFIIPYSSTSGMTGLRFRLAYNPPYTPSQACFNYSSGYETEDYVVDITAAPGCSGIPSAGVAFAVDSTCPNVPLVLNDTTYTFGQGITYEWEQSPLGASSWTAIPGATNPTHIIQSGINTPMEYRFKVTCANGNNTSYSNSFTVGIRPATQCYCTPLYTTACSVGDDIDDVIFIGDVAPGINNLNTPCPTSGYINYSALSATVSPGLTYSGNVTTNYSCCEYVRIWIDTSMDGVFQANETFANLDNIGSSSSGAFNITIPQNLAIGSYRMRVRLVYGMSSSLTIDPCISYTYGEAHDYTINVTAPPTCLPITSPTVGTTVFNAATVSWNQSNSNPGIGYQWVVVPQGSTPSATAISSGFELPGDTVANATGLSASTNYTMFIRAICSSSDSSVWAGVNFTTPCSTFVAPYAETFNGTTTPNCWTNSGVAPNGWMFGTGFSTPGYDAAGTNDHSGITGSTFAWVDGSYVTNNQTAVLTSPVIDIQSLTNARLRYFLVSYNPTYAATNGNNRLIVAGWNGATWVTLDSVQQSLSAGWNQRIASLSALGSVTTTQLRFTYTGTATTPFYNDIMIDDIYVESTPTCPAPTSIVVTSPTSSSVTLNWTENGTATSWQVRYVPFGSAGAGTTTGVIATKPYVLSGLTGGAYDVYVRSICGPNDTSAWSLAQLAATLPPNDSCAFAIPLVGGNTITSYNNGATQSIAACDATPVANDVWYSFNTGSIGGSVTVTVVSTLADLVMQVFSGSCTGTLTPMMPTASSAPVLQACIDGPAAGTEYGTYTVTANTTYYVRVYGYNTDQGTFTIVAAGTPLAIKVAKISAENVGNRNRINWVTEEEAKGDVFDLERSADGRNFTAIATLAAKGKPSTYTYWDEDPIAGVNYYRLKMTDAAGRSEYSSTVTATAAGAGKFFVEAFPNPVSDLLTVKVYGTDDATGTVTISDATGKVVKVLTLENGMVTVDMKGIAQGMYLLKYTDNSHTQMIKVNKQ